MCATRPLMSCPARPAARLFPLPLQVMACAMAGLAVMQLCRLGGAAGDAADWWIASALYLAGSGVVLMLMRRFYPFSRIGGCNAVTLIRAALLAALIPPLLAGDAAGLTVAVIGGVALALDGVDGWMARRSGLASAFGARFDMEVDAALALILSLHVLSGTAVGAEILLLGLPRYMFVAAGALWPVLTAPLPQRFRRKLICVVQLATLVLLQLPALPGDLAIPLARLAGAALLWSFAVDIRWLMRHA
ncbi:CDP-alcohol phosphatidyltransferase family protein [Paracoccus sp. Z330]|uniref:CDP-alcohol phosphatidyltransferase family protein n=1 Tax=Paracoccus onchidii TaxID=3017813 RepID=A0ABT4ZEJ2_9RHOB|nr:CDP-alcohol phosphatidyltransferase family protein [Paracoccus onchidii]MDB6177753.1 CDP-alcohol phosphatidyltransferase family protein [Paracoccus onchidii]